MQRAITMKTGIAVDLWSSVANSYFLLNDLCVLCGELLLFRPIPHGAVDHHYGFQSSILASLSVLAIYAAALTADC